MEDPILGVDDSRVATESGQENQVEECTVDEDLCSLQLIAHAVGTQFVVLRNGTDTVLDRLICCFPKDSIEVVFLFIFDFEEQRSQLRAYSSELIEADEAVGCNNEKQYE